MFTTIAFSENQNAGGATVKMKGAVDNSLRVVGDSVFVPDFANRIIGAWALVGTNAVFARLVSPSLRRLNPWYITPISKELYSTTNFVGVIDPNLSTPLDHGEALEAEYNGAPGAGEQASIIVWLAGAQITPIQGRIFTARASWTAALVAGAWASGELDFIDELPAGNYKVVGAYMIAPTAVAFRFVPVGGFFRPGAPVANAENLMETNLFRHGKLGEWFQFRHDVPPNVEVLSSAVAGSTTYYLYIDLMPV